MTSKFDAIVIGTGQAGAPLASRLADEGQRVAVIERKHFGGTCVNVGCVPTKTLVASARAIHLARRGAEFGFDAGDIRVDMARVRARKDAIVRKSREGVEAWMRGLAHTEVIVGEARFVAPRTVQVGPRTWTAPRVFLNLGGRSVRPALQGIDDVETLDNVSILAMEWESAEDSAGASDVSTDALGEEVFASTIQASVLGQEVPDELDDAEIERSIREINEAIRRSSQQKKN